MAPNIARGFRFHGESAGRYVTE